MDDLLQRVARCPRIGLKKVVEILWHCFEWALPFPRTRGVSKRREEIIGGGYNWQEKSNFGSFVVSR
jgi:hypothetical protein